MKKRYRLLRKVDFQEVIKGNQRILSANLVCYYKSKPILNNIRTAILIPKKKCKPAHKRKYLKRLFWALNSNRNLDDFPAVRCVFFYRESFFVKFRNNSVNFSELRDEYSKLVINLSRRIK